jgi:NAD(P)-dependent dehydrogenase (short-subunit alcohol dehydrogenase family)
MKIVNSVALVTGANRGIGRAFVEALQAAGARKIYAAARDTASLDETVAADPKRIVPIALDVTDTKAIRRAVAQASDVTLLVNNAGVAGFAGFIAADSVESARAEMEVNYFGTLDIIRAFAPVLKANGGGAIINLGSIASHVNFPLLGSYSASKAATHSLTQGVRAELRAQGTQVIGVYPGPVDTDMAATFEMDKVPPAQIAEAALTAVAENIEDVFPDQMAADLHSGLLRDPKAVEAQVGEMLSE